MAYRMLVFQDGAQYSAGDLPAGDEVQVETHLAGCEECSAYLAQSRMAWKMLDEWEAQMNANLRGWI